MRQKSVDAMNIGFISEINIISSNGTKGVGAIMRMMKNPWS